MREKTSKVTSMFFILAILSIIITMLLTSLINYKVFRPKPEEIRVGVSQMNLDSEELSFSGYRILKDKPTNYLIKLQDSQGKTFYLENDSYVLNKMVWANIVSFLLISLTTIKIIGYYRQDIRNKTLWPVAKLSDVMFNIMSGTSNEGDLDILLEEIQPLIDNNMSSEKLEQSINKLFTAEKQRREFTANVTHELKTPLTSINGYAEMIASGLANEEDMVKFSNVILDEGRRLLEMIDEIIRLSQYESASTNIMDYEFLDLGETAEQICEEMQVYAKTKDINLTCLSQKVMVKVDYSMIYELMANLISNGIKYNTPPGNVNVSVAKSLDYAEIVVEDDGIGISEEDQKRIFERFYMVSRNGKRHSGTGLGLSLVKHIVERHNGKIIINSELGKGSKFIIQIPFD